MRGYMEKEAEEILSELDSRSMKELETLFKEGDVPSYEDVKGETLGRFIGWNEENSWLVDVLVKLLFESPLGRWTGKEFSESFEEKERGCGMNLFDNMLFPKRFPFDTYVTEANLDSKPSMSLDYRPYLSLMSRLVDYVKLIRPGVVLGRMHYRYPFQKETTFLGFFSLVRYKGEE